MTHRWRHSLAAGAAGTPTLLDGGMGHLLRRNGVAVRGVIGSMERFLNVALANREQPEVVLRSHLEYLRAGADVITTNNYACVPAALEGRGPPEKITALIAAAGQIAVSACEAFRKEAPSVSRPMVAGCVPPLHESYRPDRVGPDDELAEGYSLIVEHVAPYADVLLCETMSSAREGRLAAAAAAAAGKPVWVAWTLAEDGSGRLRSGEPIEEAVAAVASCASIEGMLLNCSSVASTRAALPRLGAAAPVGVAVGAYANGFNTVKAAGGGASDLTGGQSEYDVQLTPEAYAECAREWVEQGASIVGGCCGVFPEHIAQVARQLAGDPSPT